ncbi:TlpA family protein disulfide reductase [Bacteroidota bacterium]
MIIKLLISVLLIFTAAIYGSNDSTPNPENTKNNLLSNVNSDMITDAAPDFTLYTLDGDEVKLSDYLGKVVILDFWATWCPPCRKAIPDLISIQNEYKDELVVIGISFDQPATQNDLVPFIESYGINYPVVLGNIEVSDAYGNIQAIPTSFIIDQEGKIINKHVGLVPKSTLVEEINLLLNGT